MSENQPPPEAPTARPTRIRWLVLVLACLTSWLLYLHRYSWGVIKSEVKSEFRFSDTQLGWLDSAFNLSYALFQVPGGLLGDLLGPAIVLPVIIFAWSGCVAGTAMVGQSWSFAGVRALFGLTQAGAYSNLSKVTRSWFPSSVRTTAQGLIGSFSGRAGGASAALVVGSLLLGWLQMDWRAAMFWLAFLGICFAMVFRLLFRDSPASHPWANPAEQALGRCRRSDPIAGTKDSTALGPQPPRTGQSCRAHAPWRRQRCCRYALCLLDTLVPERGQRI